MKKVLLVACLLLVCLSGAHANNEIHFMPDVYHETDTVESMATEASGKIPKNLESMERTGFRVLEEQSLWVDLEDWGRVNFVCGWYSQEGIRVLKMVLVDDEQNVLYEFSDLLEDVGWFFFEVRAISFVDANKDGKKDVVVIAEYITGIGPTGAIPFPVAAIYLQKDEGFVRVKSLDEQLMNFESIEMVLEFLSENDIELNGGLDEH